MPQQATPTTPTDRLLRSLLDLEVALDELHLGLQRIIQRLEDTSKLDQLEINLAGITQARETLGRTA